MRQVGKTNFQIFKADVLANPQTFALVKHWNEIGVTVHSVSAATRHNDLISGIDPVAEPFAPHFLTC
jgi:hypothetical protein